MLDRIIKAARAAILKERNDTGAMIALFLPDDVAQSIALEGGEDAEALHITLVYLAEDATTIDAEALERLTASLGEDAASRAPLAGTISGVGRFNGASEPVVYATVDVPGLAELRTHVLMLAEEAGISPATDHDFTPHVTLAYGDVPLPDVADAPVEFDSLVVANGGERIPYAFGNGPSEDQGYRAKAEYDEASLPDDSFAVVRLGPDQPRRFLAYRAADGTIDAPHLRGAMSRLRSEDLTDDERAAGERILRSAATGILGDYALARIEKVAERIAEDGITGEVEVEAFEWLADMSALVYEAKAEGWTELYADTGTEVVTLAEYADRLEAMRKRWEDVLRDPRAMAIERSLRDVTGKPHMASPLTRKVRKDVSILKADASQRYTLGVAYPVRRVGKRDPQDVDAHADYMTAEELEAAAWRFMASGAKDSGLMHKDGTDGAGKVVESYIYRGPRWTVEGQVVEEGDWLLGVVWGEEAWAKIASGELTGYSMQGFATREAA